MARFSWKINACDCFSQNCFFRVSDDSGSIWATTKKLAIFCPRPVEKIRVLPFFGKKSFCTFQMILNWFEQKPKTNRKQFLGENFRLKSDFASLYLQPKFLRICEFFLQHAPKSNVFIAISLCRIFVQKYPSVNKPQAFSSDTKIINITLELTQYFANFLTHLLLSSVKKWPM